MELPDSSGETAGPNTKSTSVARQANIMKDYLTRVLVLKKFFIFIKRTINGCPATP